MQKCRNASLVGLPPETRRPSLSNLDRFAGSSLPNEALVGVISQPPSLRRTLMFPVDPEVGPREQRESPTSQISSRARVSSPMSLPLSSHGQSAGEEISSAEIAGLERHLQFSPLSPARAHQRPPRRYSRSEPECRDAQPIDRGAGRLTACDDESAHAE